MQEKWNIAAEKRVFGNKMPFENAILKVRKKERKFFNENNNLEYTDEFPESILQCVKVEFRQGPVYTVNLQFSRCLE